MTDETVGNRKQIAQEFLQMVVAGQIKQAYQKYVDMQGKHHNFFFPAGFPALEKAMQENHDQFPNKILEIKNVLADGDLVAVHSHLIFKQGEEEMAVLHLFRFKGDRIIEMWDIGHSIPGDSPNADEAF